MKRTRGVQERIKGTDLYDTLERLRSTAQAFQQEGYEVTHVSSWSKAWQGSQWSVTVWGEREIEDEQEQR